MTVVKNNVRQWFLAELHYFDKDYKGRLILAVRNIRFLDGEEVLRHGYNLIVQEYPNIPLGSIIRFEANFYEFETQACFTWADKFEVVSK